MNIKKLTLLLLSLLFLPHAIANKNQLIKACIDTGEAKEICECAASKWLDGLNNQELEYAKSLIQSMRTNTPPSPSMQAKVMPLMQKYQRIGMECAMNTDVQETEEQVDISDFIPKGAMSEQDMKDFNSIVSGGANPLDKLKSMDKRDQNRRSDARDAKQAEQIKRDEELAKRRAEVKAERQQVSATSVITQPRANFKKLFELETQLYGNSTSVTTCLWNQLISATKEQPAGRLAVYFAAIGGGDFDQPEEYRPYLNNAYKQYEVYQASRSRCL